MLQTEFRGIFISLSSLARETHALINDRTRLLRCSVRLVTLFVRVVLIRTGLRFFMPNSVRSTVLTELNGRQTDRAGQMNSMRKTIQAEMPIKLVLASSLSSSSASVPHAWWRSKQRSMHV
jgi:hypothetical protein